MKKSKSLEKVEIVPMNDNLYDEFLVQELETRLETDPLLSGGIIGLPDGDIGDAAEDFCVIHCGEHSGCMIKFKL